MIPKYLTSLVERKAVLLYIRYLDSITGKFSFGKMRCILYCTAHSFRGVRYEPRVSHVWILDYFAF